MCVHKYVRAYVTYVTCFLISRSASTGSLVSVAGSSEGVGSSEGAGQGGEESGPRLETFIEMFLMALIILNHRRKHKPSRNSNL